MKIYKFIIDDQTKIEQIIPGSLSFVWTACLGVALASSQEEAKEILRVKLKEVGAFWEWLEFAEVIEIPLTAATYIAVVQG